jgi:nucleotide-binding universal stress UspA family protein
MRILVATDGSTDATAAIEWLARRPLTVTALRVLTVVTLPPSSIDIPTVRAYYQALRTGGERLVEAGCHALAASGPAVESQVLEGDPRERIVEAAREWKADLLVVGARGLGNLAGALLGSVSTAVVRRARCPVLVIKGRLSELRRAVVAVDGSKESLAAARFLAALLLPRRMAVRLLAVLDLPPAMAPAGGLAPGVLTTPEELFGERRATLEGVLSRVAAGLRTIANEVECSVVVGRSAAEIVSAANEPGVGLVVVGARGLGRVRRWLLGSVSERVLLHAECPVLVVPLPTAR